MKYFNKEQIDRLREAEYHFNTVVYGNWKRGTERKLNDMIADVYEECTNEKIRRDWSCGKCTFDAYYKIGKLYFSSIKELEKVDNETEPTLISKEIENIVTDNETKKRGRPKTKK